ncbi:YhfX family PLP-dependent enzyme [Symbiobacterium thermophilum]|uniref:YhfX family PLP-dependent enzyme n=1 Tax=Symbiobacterium thermophilum TaxID=2734 RepID=UPI0035C6645C
MFLEVTARRNPRLIDAALRFHAEGRLPPNTYVLDLDAIRNNARTLAEAARREGIQLYFMSKQLNRNPQVIAAVAEAGISRGVAVDIDDARAFREAGVPLGHVGHLVQIPRAFLPQVLSWRPEVMTVFSLAHARMVSDAAVRLGLRQDLLLRVASGCFLPGQEGGIGLEELPAVARAIRELPGVRVAGVTAFPCLVAEDGRPVATPNLEAVTRAAALLRDELGMEIAQVNAPSLTCAATLPLLRQAGATHGEPGHAITGTTPLHAVSDQPELPAMVYLTEVSHTYGGRAYVYGGGSYPRGHMQNALVGTALRRAPLHRPAAENIDYYLTLDDPLAREGEPVIAAFRTQAFTARANLALVEGVQQGAPRLAGLYDRANRPLDLTI